MPKIIRPTRPQRQESRVKAPQLTTATLPAESVPIGHPTLPGRYEAWTAHTQMRIGDTARHTSAAAWQIFATGSAKTRFPPTAVPSNHSTSSQWRASISAVVGVLESMIDLAVGEGRSLLDIYTRQQKIAEIASGQASANGDVDKWDQFYELRARLTVRHALDIRILHRPDDDIFQRLREMAQAACREHAEYLAGPM